MTEKILILKRRIKMDIIDLQKRKLIRAKDIVELIGISRSTVDNWAKYGYLTRRKIGRNIFYDISEVQALMG